MEAVIGAVDQGTTGTRFALFDAAGRLVAAAYREHRQFFPRPGWVEHDPEEIWQCTLTVMAEALAQANLRPGQLRALGVTNQRESVVVWDARDGRPLHPVIVWQDRRTAARCRELIEAGHEAHIRERTGLPLDPYFSATKLEWLRREVPAVREAAAAGRARCGTLDSWLLFRLTGAHVTDPTNASRTLLFDLHRLAWSDELRALFDVPAAMLPEVVPSSGQSLDLRVAAGLPAEGVPVCGILGDQQAALFGQTGFARGDLKNTYGTGSFLLLNTGETPVVSRQGLLTTVAYQREGEPARYALEGSVFVTGAAVQWLRDSLGLIESAAETEALAESIPDTGGVYLVPAFAGLGAPYWDPEARGTLAGLTRGSGRAHLARAALEAMAYQTRDVVEAMRADAGVAITALRVDGGAVRNNFLCRFQADLLGVPVWRPVVQETTALGAAYAAGLAAGVWPNPEALRAHWQLDRQFDPSLPAERREALYAGWQRAVRTARTWARDA
ncbi:MAG: glycerol kinase GlpK [Armatimonadetes bacterium]|nr:glycerol kinase GlpK [Armatimonadota bacterium]